MILLGTLHIKGVILQKRGAIFNDSEKAAFTKETQGARSHQWNTIHTLLDGCIDSPDSSRCEDEYTKFWTSATGKRLADMRIFYGSDKTFANDMPEDLRLAMLPTDANKARREIEKSFPVDDPKSAFGVVGTASRPTTPSHPER
jgi:hypothetical protein